jgi:hypothetical protein
MHGAAGAGFKRKARGAASEKRVFGLKRRWRGAAGLRVRAEVLAVAVRTLAGSSSASGVARSFD